MDFKLTELLIQYFTDLGYSAVRITDGYHNNWIRVSNHKAYAYVINVDNKHIEVVACYGNACICGKGCLLFQGCRHPLPDKFEISDPDSLNKLHKALTSARILNEHKEI